ncbi:MAG: nitrous oxide-stimulated promoter family protein [Candidatus Atribacteria bacterium]|nr:nitrous oxide-stimulated promoter family protein [Candidatus Atribacteria bacterium]
MSLKNEKKTVKAMIMIYCSAHHEQKNGLCMDCQRLFEYAESRIDNCKYKSQNLVCSECKVHCFHPEKREEIKEIMRYSGKKMLWKHPVLAVRYLINKSMSKRNI